MCVLPITPYSYVCFSECMYLHACTHTCMYMYIHVLTTHYICDGLLRLSQANSHTYTCTCTCICGSFVVAGLAIIHTRQLYNWCYLTTSSPLGVAATGDFCTLQEVPCVTYTVQCTLYRPVTQQMTTCWNVQLCNVIRLAALYMILACHCANITDHEF